MVVRAARLRGDYLKMYRYAMKDIAGDGVSEVCFELGEYYFGRQEYEEAAVWFYNAAYETQSILNARRGGDMAILRLADCYEAMGIAEQAEDYRAQAAAWRLPSVPRRLRRLRGRKEPGATVKKEKIRLVQSIQMR